MCGLFGWNLRPEMIAKRRWSVQSLAVSLLLQNDRRGGDSWGFYSVTHGCRRAGLGSVGEMSRKSLRTLTGSATVIGHTRRATAGNVSHRNCHPFDCGTVIGAHNGIVFNHHDLNLSYRRQCEVDSHHIFLHLEEDQPLSDIESYGAITVHSRLRPDEPVYLGRFNGGELAIAAIPGGVVWSSDTDHLWTSIRLAGLTVDTLYRVDSNVLYAITDDYRVVIDSDIDIGEPVYLSKGDLAATGHSSADVFSLSESDISDLEKWDDRVGG